MFRIYAPKATLEILINYVWRKVRRMKENNATSYKNHNIQHHFYGPMSWTTRPKWWCSVIETLMTNTRFCLTKLCPHFDQQHSKFLFSVHSLAYTVARKLTKAQRNVELVTTDVNGKLLYWLLIISTYHKHFLITSFLLCFPRKTNKKLFLFAFNKPRTMNYS